jgi:hypothetical protein
MSGADPYAVEPGAATGLSFEAGRKMLAIVAPFGFRLGEELARIDDGRWYRLL